MSEHNDPPDAFVDDGPEGLTHPTDYSGVIPADAPARQSTDQVEAERMAAEAGNPPDYIASGELGGEGGDVTVESGTTFTQNEISGVGYTQRPIPFGDAGAPVALPQGAAPVSFAAVTAPAVTITPVSEGVPAGVQTWLGYGLAFLNFAGAIAAVVVEQGANVGIPDGVVYVCAGFGTLLASVTGINRTVQKRANITAAKDVAVAALTPVDPRAVAAGQAVPPMVEVRRQD